MLVFGRELATIKTVRSGVIPYRVVNDKLEFLFGRDTKYHEYTDFGGGIKRYEYALNGGLREFKEESSNIFGNIYDKSNLFNGSIAIVDDLQLSTFKFIKISIIFAPICPDLQSRVTTFIKNNEISEISWFSLDKTRDYLSNKRIWKNVRLTLNPFFYQNKFINELFLSYKYSKI